MYSSLFILSLVQKDLSLIDVSCCVHLHSFCCVLLGVGAQSLKPVKLLNKQFQTFLLFCDRRSVAQQCWIRLHSSSNIHARTLHMVYKSLRVASFPLCTAAPNIVGKAHHCQHCWLNNVGSWPCSRGSKTNPNFQLVNKPSAGAVLRDQSRRSFTVVIDNTVYHLLMKNKKGEGRGFKKRERERERAC